MHLAVESHVDRSVDGPGNFMGTFTFLEAVRGYYATLSYNKKGFRFHHVSTDEVFGAMEESIDPPFNEHTPYAPRTLYSSSKAASDHLVGT